MNTTNTTKKPADIATTITRDQPNGKTTVNDTIRLTFANGREVVLQVGDLPDNILGDALMHGLKQKLVDAAAMSRNPDTGRSATLDDKYAAVNEVAGRLVIGAWNKVRDGAATSGGLLFRALCEMYARKTPEEIKAFLEQKSDEEKAALRANPKIAAIIATLKAAQAKSSDIDTDAMLGDLE